MQQEIDYLSAPAQRRLSKQALAGLVIALLDVGGTLLLIWTLGGSDISISELVMIGVIGNGIPLLTNIAAVLELRADKTQKGMGLAIGGLCITVVWSIFWLWMVMVVNSLQALNGV